MYVECANSNSSWLEDSPRVLWLVYVWSRLAFGFEGWRMRDGLERGSQNPCKGELRVQKNSKCIEHKADLVLASLLGCLAVLDKRRRIRYERERCHKHEADDNRLGATLDSRVSQDQEGPMAQTRAKSGLNKLTKDSIDPGIRGKKAIVWTKPKQAQAPKTPQAKPKEHQGPSDQCLEGKSNLIFKAFGGKVKLKFEIQIQI
ncbi:hypothetical protein Lal_00043736 [Lupinus albus]|nr:hypothetical protein Lal_00043736 [Lupinus albus]